MYEVRISARLLSFPRMCCCCGGNSPDSTYTASYTRTTGKKVVKKQTKSWNFPICSGCSEWIEAVRAAQTVGLGFGCAFVLGVIVLSIGIAVFLEEGPGRTAIAVGLLMVYFSGLMFRRWRRAKVAADDLLPADVCNTTPVVYNGWDGTVHTFLFANVKFRGMFVAHNIKKVLG